MLPANTGSVGGVLVAIGVLLTLTTLLAWVNDRLVKAPATIGVTASGAVAAVLLVVADSLGVDFGLKDQLASVLARLDLSSFLLQGILSVLLFAGAMELDARDMLRQRWSIAVLAMGATVVSTVLIGLGAWGIFALLGVGVPLVWAALFGALISPTDPVAVLDLLRRAKVPRRIETLISGEALFNDGIGIVVFLALGSFAGLALGAHPVDSVGDAAVLFVREALGGALFGGLLGFVGYAMVRSIEDPGLEVLVTLTMVVGGYGAALALGVSGPLAMVVAGLVISATKHDVFAEATVTQVENFWVTLDQVLNILLFSFIGLDVLLTPLHWQYLVAGLLLIPMTLVVRWLSVGVPMKLLPVFSGYGRWTTSLLTWGGLRGGIAISLALGLPHGPYRSAVVTATYVVVVFSIVIQGLTVMPIVRRAAAEVG